MGAAQDETVHTTANHPWLTTDRGWVLAGDLNVGELVRTLDGQTATVAWVHTVPGQADYYNLTVADDHTYAVGDGRYVVHNCKLSDLPSSVTSDTSGTRVTLGTQEGEGPFFQSHVSSDSSEFTLEMAYRNGLTEHASDVFAMQFEQAGGQAESLQSFVLQNVEEPGTLEMWDELGSVRGSPLDKMLQHLSNDLGVDVGRPSWNGNDLIYPVISK